MKISEMYLLNQTDISTFFRHNSSNFKLKTVLKALKLPKLSNTSSLKGPGTSEKQKTVSRDNHGQNISDKL